jgi:hypothetical protein
VLAFERVVSISGLTASNDTSSSQSGVTINLAGNNGPTSFVDPFSASGISAHGMFAGGVTLGAGLGYQHTTLSDPGGDIGVSTLSFAPRVGYMATLSPIAAFWIRGGVTYASETLTLPNTTTSCIGSSCTNSSSTEDLTLSFFDVSLDPAFVLFPIPHVGFLIGALLDIGVSSSASSGSLSASNNVKLTDYGVSGGVALAF